MISRVRCLPAPLSTSMLFPQPPPEAGDDFVCMGGDLSPGSLVCAYAQGYFPWYGRGDPLLWHFPHRRCVLIPDHWHISQRSRRKIRRSAFEITINKAFPQVMAACAAPRKGEVGTWIHREIMDAYARLHKLGYAHSLEVWQGRELVGGLYGVALGRFFFGESMFRKVSESSRAALGALMGVMQRFDFLLLDCQQASPHMLAMGARNMDGSLFGRLLQEYLETLAPTPLAKLRGPVPYLMGDDPAKADKTP